MSSLKPKEIDFNEQWSIVLGTVRSVISMSRFGQTNKATWQERFFGLIKKQKNSFVFLHNKILCFYVDIYYLCVATPDSHAERLYEETKKFLEDHCKSMKKEISESDQNMLSTYVKYWTEYKTGSDCLNILYAYLNTHYVRKRQTNDLDNSYPPFESLSNMYKLLKPTHIGINYMVEKLQDHISQIGHAKIQSLKGENLSTLFVETLLELHTKYMNVIKETFTSDPEFVSSLDKACTTIVNMKYGNRLSAKAPELLAHYCDSLLRKSSKAASDSEIEEKLLSSITIFKYLDDKDYFQRFYQKMLARRLINQQSISIDAEEFMVTKLKQICGYEFTGKLARMFQDIKVSDDLNVEFLEYLKSELSSTAHNQTMTSLIGLDFNIYVLQANSWPVSQPTTNTFILPHLLEKPLHMFEAFYGKKYSGRKLCWMYNLSNAEIRMTHLDRSYFVTMGTYQMAILLQFNEHQQLTITEVEDATKLNIKELEKQVISLIDAKFLLADTNNLTSSSIISINFDYKNKRTKFKVPLLPQKEATHDSESSQKAVEEDRKFYLQAVIVRIMKARKKLKHNSLIEEVITQSKQRFLPSIHIIKKCIEILIDKQYLERSSNDEYSYIA
ncbi:unnamed protein product [Rotaria sp. Silwood2]|nr:unnamed protein product [Rotaria sp. Silwood2]CAF3061640.1 unnamed protein product [Rotaria sp. Silwood2]